MKLCQWSKDLDLELYFLVKSLIDYEVIMKKGISLFENADLNIKPVSF